MSFISDLSPPILNADLTESAQRDDVLRRLIAMRDGTQATHEDLVGFFDACLSLVHLVPVLDDAEADEVGTMARRLIELVGVAYDKAQHSPPPMSIPVSPAEEETRLGGESLLGEILVHFGVATKKQIAQALTQQAIKPRKLGQVIVEMGVATPEDVLNALRLQRDLTRKALKDIRQKRSKEDFLLGQVLVRKGFVPPEILVDALRTQPDQQKPVGQILIELGALTQEQLDEALQEQKDLRERS